MVLSKQPGEDKAKGWVIVTKLLDEITHACGGFVLICRHTKVESVAKQSWRPLMPSDFPKCPVGLQQ